MPGLVAVLAVAWVLVLRESISRRRRFDGRQMVRVVRRRETLRSWHWNNTPFDRN